MLYALYAAQYNDPAYFRSAGCVLVMQYIQRCGNRRDLGSRLVYDSIICVQIETSTLARQESQEAW